MPESLTLPEVAQQVAALPGTVAEICGAWLWISGNTRPHREILKSLKCIWHAKKQKWYWRPPGKSRYSKRKSDTPMPKIRLTYGSELITDNDE